MQTLRNLFGNIQFTRLLDGREEEENVAVTGEEGEVFLWAGQCYHMTQHICKETLKKDNTSYFFNKSRGRF